MKRAYLVISVLVIFVTLLTIGCAAPAATTKPPTTTSQPTTPAAPAAPIEIIAQHTVPQVIPLAKLTLDWAKMIEEKSGGKVKFTWYWSASMVPQPDVFKSVSTGVLDVAYYPIGADFQPLSFFVYLPFVDIKNMDQGTQMYKKLYDQFPDIQKEYAGVKLLEASVGPPVQLHFTKKNVKTPADMKGLKMGVVGREMSVYITSLGAAPVEGKSVADTPMNLQSGVTDGIANHWPLVEVFRLTPMLPFHTNFAGSGLGYSVDTFIMNPKKFDSLSADTKKAIEDASAWYMVERAKLDEAEVLRAIGNAQKANQTINEISAADQAGWKDLAKASHDDWIKRMTDKGKPAQAIYDAVKKLSAEMK